MLSQCRKPEAFAEVLADVTHGPSDPPIESGFKLGRQTLQPDPLERVHAPLLAVRRIPSSLLVHVEQRSLDMQPLLGLERAMQQSGCELGPLEPRRPMRSRVEMSPQKFPVSRGLCSGVIVGCTGTQQQQLTGFGVVESTGVAKVTPTGHGVNQQVVVRPSRTPSAVAGPFKKVTRDQGLGLRG